MGTLVAMSHPSLSLSMQFPVYLYTVNYSNAGKNVEKLDPIGLKVKV